MRDKKKLKRVIEVCEKLRKEFKPSTTEKQGDILETNFKLWKTKIQPKQEKDWEEIKSQIPYFKQLNEVQKGMIFNYFRGFFNWRGWGTMEGIMLLTEELESKKINDRVKKE